MPREAKVTGFSVLPADAASSALIFCAHLRLMNSSSLRRDFGIADAQDLQRQKPRVSPRRSRPPSPRESPRASARSTRRLSKPAHHVRLDGKPDHGKRRRRGDDAAEVRRLARRADNDFNPVLLRIRCKRMRFLGRTMRGNDPNLRLDPEPLQNRHRGLYDGEIRFAAHQNSRFRHIYT